MPKSHEQYNKEKLAVAFNLAQQNKFFRKARAIIVKDDKILMLHRTGNHTLQLPGGGIDEKENAKTATEREVMEEIKAIIKNPRYLGKYYYTAKLEFNNKQFLSKRVEFIYICDFVKFCDNSPHNAPIGIDGEFLDNVELLEVPFSHINKLSIPPKLKQKALEYLNTHFKNKKELD